MMASTMRLVGIFVIDFTAFVLALVAEQTRSTAKVAMDYGYCYQIGDSCSFSAFEFDYYFCVYDSNIATKLGILAAALLLLGQILRFNKVNKNKGCNACGFFLSTLCWGTFIMGEALLLMGAVKNIEKTTYKTMYDPPNCKTLRKGVFEVAAAFVMISSLLSNFMSMFFFDHFDTTPMGDYTSLP